jgi:HEXXH motif-containing protein
VRASTAEPTAARAFAWRPPLDRWLDELGRGVEQWSPNPALGLDREALARCVLSGVELREPWLWHPTAQAVNLPEGVRVDPLFADTQFAVWIAAHSEDDLGTVTLPQRMRLWFPSGPDWIEAGTHGLGSIAERMAEPAIADVAVDAWCDCVGAELAGSWAAQPPTTDAEIEEFERQLARLLSCLEWLSSAMPECHAWVLDVARVIVPLRGSGGGFRSGSAPDLPGAIHLDLLSELQILEGLIHESAHCHLFRAEAAAALVDPADDARFPSPLRPEPRPLRGVLLAYHALAYICVLYGRLLAIANAGGDTVATAYDDLRARAQDAEQVLVAERGRLTSAGAAFFDRTQAELGDVYA